MDTLGCVGFESTLAPLADKQAVFVCLWRIFTTITITRVANGAQGLLSIGTCQLGRCLVSAATTPATPPHSSVAARPVSTKSGDGIEGTVTIFTNIFAIFCLLRRVGITVAKTIGTQGAQRHRALGAGPSCLHFICSTPAPVASPHVPVAKATMSGQSGHGRTANTAVFAHK
jgi:hypothetical protein